MPLFIIEYSEGLCSLMLCFEMCTNYKRTIQSISKITLYFQTDEFATAFSLLVDYFM